MEMQEKNMFPLQTDCSHQCFQSAHSSLVFVCLFFLQYSYRLLFFFFLNCGMNAHSVFFFQFPWTLREAGDEKLGQNSEVALRCCLVMHCSLQWLKLVLQDLLTSSICFFSPVLPFFLKFVLFFSFHTAGLGLLT